MQPTYFQHTHNGTDTPQVSLQDILYTRGTALTTASTTALSTGGAATLSTSDQTVIDNMRTRINELEARLQALMLIQ